MKGKYINTQIMMACLSKSAGIKKDIYAQLEATLAERNEILKRLKNRTQLLPGRVVEKDIHTQLQETIAGHKRKMHQWERFFKPEQDSNKTMEHKKAA